MRKCRCPVLSVFAACCLAACAGTAPTPGERPPLTARQRDAALKALLGADEFSEYVTITDTVEATAWLARFWTKHDPTPTTDKNEFREEHERRVNHAIHLFGGPTKSGPPWDDRGEVYIRYGQPDERLIRQNGTDDAETGSAAWPDAGADPVASPLNHRQAATEVWTYYRWNQTFQFEDEHAFGFFRLVPVTDPEFKRQGTGEFSTTRVRAIDLQPAIYYHEYGKNLIDYALDVVRFRGDHGNWRLDVNLGYPLFELGRDADSVSVAIRRTLVVRNEDQGEIYGEEGRIHRLVGPADSTNRLMIEQKLIELPPGAYTLAVTIDDLCTGKSGTYLKSFRLPKYVVPEVQEISDVELASYVWSIYEPGSPFVKKDHMIVPLPSRIYLPDQPLAFYYEVYNLLLGPDGKTHYQVDYDITDERDKSHHHFSEPGEQSDPGRQASRVGTIDLAGIPSGEYILSIKVTDLVGHEEKTAVGQFKKSD